MNKKVGLMLAILVIVANLAWRQMNGRLFYWEAAPAEPQPVPAAPTAELLVTKEGGYVLDGKVVAVSALEGVVANLRRAKRGVRIDVLAAPDAPLAAIATALQATREADLSNR